MVLKLQERLSEDFQVLLQIMFKVDVDRTLFDINFAYYYLSSPKIYKMLMNAQSSSTMPAITFGMLGQIRNPIV